MKHEIIKKLKTNSRTFETGKLMWNAEKEDVEISKIYPVKETIYGSGYAVYDREYKVLYAVYDREYKVLSFVPKNAVIDIEMEPLP